MVALGFQSLAGTRTLSFTLLLAILLMQGLCFPQGLQMQTCPFSLCRQALWPELAGPGGGVSPGPTTVTRGEG